MNHLTHAINLMGISEFREFIREPLPEPRPPRKWFANQMARLRRSEPDMPAIERAQKIKDMWYNLPSHEQKMLSKEPTLKEKRKMSLKIKAQDIEATPEITEEEYAAKVEEIKNKYEPKILQILGEMRDVLNHAGYSCSEPYDMHDDQFSWWMSVSPTEREGDLEENDVDIRFEIAESAQYEGTLEGINFSVNINSVGGSIIGSLTPYNYSSDVWVDVRDDAAVEERFNIFMQTNLEEVVDLVEDFWRE